MISQHEIDHVIGSTLYSQDDEKIGRVGQVFLDDNTGQPEFLTVNTGLFGASESFVPAQEATFSSDRVVVPFGKDKVKDAHNVDVDGGHLDESQERQLFDYYGLDYGTGGTGQDWEGSVDRMSGQGHDTSGPNTDDAMTRSEERLDVGTTQQERGRARLRKYVTTEQQTVTVPVQKERAVLETEPVTGDNVDRATDGPAISEEEHEVVLSEERPVVSKTTEPVERVRLGTETVTEQQTVTEDVRREHIEA
jgi:uncharacterized protein (TIGR02271 family)